MAALGNQHVTAQHARLRRLVPDPEPADIEQAEADLTCALDWLEEAESLVTSDDPTLAADNLALVQRLLKEQGLPTEPMPKAAIRLWIHLAMRQVAEVAHMLAFPDGEAGEQ